MKAVILAGGLGTRLKSVCENTPKPLIKLCEKPVLEHQINALKAEGITEFILVLGHLSEQIKAYFGDGKKLGVSISYYVESKPLGTAGALFKLGLKEDFLLCNGDLIFNFSLAEMLSFHKEKNALATLLTHPNNHPFDSTLFLTDGDVITGVLPKENKPFSYANLCNAGIGIISPELLEMYSFDDKADLDKEVITPAIKTGKIYSYKTFEYVKDMGTPDRLKAVENDIKSGIVSKKHKKHTQKAVFLDRDGTINIHKGYVTKPCEIELIDGVCEAINKLHSFGFLVIIATNQPVIARGECTIEELTEIHNRIETLLGENGAFIDGIYYCPHHPDSGFPNEIKELKIKCDCRKPQPGLLLKAQKDFNIDLEKSYMVGDSLRDVEAGINAKCTPVFLGEKTTEALPEKTPAFSSLKEFAESLEN